MGQRPAPDVAVGRPGPSTAGTGRPPVRIAYLITRSDTMGGAHVHVRDLAAALTRAGNEVTVVVGGDGDGPYVHHLRARGVTVVAVPTLVRPVSPRHDLRAFRDVRRVVGSLDVDLLSTHSAKAGLVGRVVGRSLGVPTLFTAHGWSFAEGVPSGRRVVYGLLEAATAPLASRVITVSHRDRALARRWLVGRRCQHVTIHNGVHDVDPSLLADPSRQPPTMISVARLDDQKDHALLLRALSGVEGPFRLDLVGDGPKEAEARALAHELGLSERVRFLGLRWDVAELLSQAQLYLLATKWEGLPRSILEGMRAGLPVVASDVGGVAELVEDGVTGRLVAPGDVAALRAAVRELLDDPPRRAALGAASRRRYEEGFTFERLLAATAAVYEEVLRVPVPT